MASVVAIGVFDGLHLGHVAILKRCVGRARGLGIESAVMSFDPHPDLVLAKTFKARPPLTPLGEKRTRLRDLGIDRLEVLPFTRELAALSPEEFVERHVIERLAPRALVVGEDFALGKGRAGNVERLRAIGASRGFEVESVPLTWLDGAPVSSTRIRELLEAGKVAEAARLLGRRYGFSGTVVTGEAIGRTLGVPTANLRLGEDRLVPGNGIYAVWARLPGETAARAAAMSIGVRPTFGGRTRALEVHVLDWDGDLVGREVDVEFAHWLRVEVAFDGRDALIAAMQADLAATRRLLAGDPARAGTGA
jgi:riboflavin kinase/FMN adenylyltransferase